MGGFPPKIFSPLILSAEDRLLGRFISIEARKRAALVAVAIERYQSGPAGKPPEDRKSTRLNSSHRCISYAVFCLKKKKKTQNKSNHTAPTKHIAKTRAHETASNELSPRRGHKP